MPNYSYNLSMVKRFLDNCKTQFVDVVGVTDSNGLYGGTGWDTGLGRMLNRMYPDRCYSSGLFGFGEGNSLGVGHGVGAGGTATNSDLTRFRAGGSGGGQDDRGGSAPAAFSDFWSTSFDTGNSVGTRNTVLQEAYWASTTSPRTHPALYNGLGLCDNAPVGTSLDFAHQLQYQVWLGKWTTASAPNLTDQPFFMLKNGAVVSGGVKYFNTDGAAANGVDFDYPFTFDFPIDSTALTASGIEARWNGTASQIHHYPFYGVFQRFIRTNAGSGWGSQQLYACGGSTSADASTWITNLGDTKLSNYLYCLTQNSRAKEFPFSVLVWIVLGANDAGQSRTKAQFKSSITSIINSFKNCWDFTCGFDTDKIGFIIMVDHQRSLTNDDQEGYRSAAMEIAVEDNSGRTASLDLNECISYDLLNRNYTSLSVPTYAANSSDTDRAHLLVKSTSEDSYTSVAYLVGNLLDGSTATMSEDISSPIFNAGVFRMRTGLTQNLSYKLGV